MTMPQPNPVLMELMRMSRGGRAGPNGIVTPQQMDSMDPEQAARLVNYLIGQVNIDEQREAKRAAFRMLAQWCAGAALVSCLLTVWVITRFYSPLTRTNELLERIADDRGRQVMPYPFPIYPPVETTAK